MPSIMIQVWHIFIFLTKMQNFQKFIFFMVIHDQPCPFLLPAPMIRLLLQEPSEKLIDCENGYCVHKFPRWCLLALRSSHQQKVPVNIDRNYDRRTIMEFCIACSMPLDNKELIGLKNDQGLFCIHCIDENKKVKSCEEIFEGGIQFFMSIVPNMDRNFAEKITRKNMTGLPYWQGENYPCLNGETATDDEFQKILQTLATTPN